VFVLFATIYGLVAYLSPGYDDEITNINLVEHVGLYQAFLLVQSQDVHPPGSILLNSALHAVLGNWSDVRVVTALMYAASAAWFFSVTQTLLGTRAALLSAAIAVLTPATLMWCTSIRWYAYFVPLLLWTLTPPRSASKYWFYIKPALGWLVLAHIGYVAIVLAPAILLFYLLLPGQSLKNFIKMSLIPWVIAAMLYIPQFLVLLRVHIKNTAHQTGGLASSLEGIAISLFSNQGLFPISVFSIVSILGWTTLLVLMGSRMLKSAPIRRGAANYGVSVLLVAVSGLAAKFRNLVVITPFQANFIAECSGTIFTSRPAVAAVICILLGNVAGIIDVAAHSNTTKASWNVPANEVERQLADLTHDCGAQRTAVYTFDPVLGYALKNNPDLLVLEYFNHYFHWSFDADAASCVAVIWTYRGALTAAQYRGLKAAVDAIHADSSRTVDLAKDPHAAIKRKLDPDYPDFLAEIVFFRGAKNLGPINLWASAANAGGAPP
jgi:hypothetical protein